MDKKLVNNAEKNVQLQKTEQNNIYFTIIKSFLITLLTVCVVIFNFFAVGICLFPKKTASLCEKLNFKGGVALCYEKIYDNTGKISDLYNLTTANITANRNKDVIKNIEKLQNDKNYNEFCDRVDTAAKNKTSISYIAYVGSVDSYLESNKIIALFNLNKKAEAKKQAISDLSRGNKYSFALETYVSEMIDANKEEELKGLFEEQINGKTVLYLIDDQIATLDYTGLGKIDQVMCVYTLLKIQKTKYNIYSIEKNTEKMQETETKITKLQSIYSNLISQ